MTPLRQVLNAAALLTGLSVASTTFAEPLAPMGPPTAEDAAAAVVTAAPVPPPAPAAVKALGPSVGAKPQPSWLASRPAPQASVAGKSSMPSTGRILGMLLVLGSLGGAALYFKRRGKADVKRPTATQRLSVVTSTRIGPKAHAVVISVAGRQMLLGVTDSSVKRLAFIDDLEDEAEDHGREREPVRRPAMQNTARAAAIAVRTIAADPAQTRSFGEMLKTAFNKKRDNVADTSPASILASETQDVVGGKPAAAPVRMLDVEGQAQGLLRRLGGPRA